MTTAPESASSATSDRSNSDSSATHLEVEAGIVTASDTSQLLSVSEDAGVDGGGNTTPVDGGWEEPQVAARSGFIDVEPTTYVRHGAQNATSSARLFYSFHPADEAPHDAPTFVFFNGGPGFATSLGLMSYGTGPMTVQLPEQGGGLVPNPWSWTQFGNLLYIDTRQAGFSYSTLAAPADPASASTRNAEAGQHNFNDYVDSADIVRVMLRVLKQNPAVQDNSVVIVGESFGGVRASLTLKYLLDPEELEDGWWFADPALAAEIAGHYDAIRGNPDFEEPRDQFRAQILIQPFVAHTQFQDQAEIFCQPGSREATIAAEAGFPCASLRSYRDLYEFDEPVGWSNTLDEGAGRHLMDPTSLQLILGVDPQTIAGLSAADRAGGFRSHTDNWTPVSPAFSEVFGALPPWDTYHVILTSVNRNEDVYDNPYPCVFFSRVVANVDTFVTNGELDSVVRTQVLPTTLLRCHGLVTEPFVDDIAVTTDPNASSPRPGQWTITYSPDSPYGAGERVVRWPTYRDAGHMVASTQPQELFEDVREFLRERGIIP